MTFLRRKNIVVNSTERQTTLWLINQVYGAGIHNNQQRRLTHQQQLHLSFGRSSEKYLTNIESKEKK